MRIHSFIYYDSKKYTLSLKMGFVFNGIKKKKKKSYLFIPPLSD